MLKTYTIGRDHLQESDLSTLGSHSSEVSWIDLCDPNPEECDRVAKFLDGPLPSTGDIDEIEASSRFYRTSTGLHIHSFVLREIDANPERTSVAFVVDDRCLVSLHTGQVPALDHFVALAMGELDAVHDVLSLFFAMIGHNVEALADMVEHLYTRLETESRSMLGEGADNLEHTVTDLARHENLNAEIRLCLMDNKRGVNFILRHRKLPEEAASAAREILQDIDSLLPHNAFLSEKVSLLMDTALGLINVRQNQIIKTFSIAAVVFLTATVVASMYGMNFRTMPELSWPWGYPFSVVLMICSAIAPYWYFKRKGWL
jgi:magnesium transporter